jgi:hypothetical protein
MTELSGICYYLLEKYNKHHFGLKPEYLRQNLGLDHKYTAQVIDYLARHRARPAFKRAVVIGVDQSTFR